MAMRLVTRSDFDGLACGALLHDAGIIDHWKFAHPKDLQDGLIPIDENDCLANVPFVPGCGLWFDHHSSEFERQELEGKYKGKVASHLLVHASFTNITVEKNVSQIMMILWLP